MMLFKAIVETEIFLTRCRPYQKNDQSWVEQKNGAIVQRIVGYRRLAGLEQQQLSRRSIDRFGCS